MKLKKLRIIPLVLCAFLSFAPISVYANPNFKDTNKNIYNGSFFNIQRDNLDLIINDMVQTSEGLEIDAYLLNTTNRTFTEITNFYLELKDSSGVIFAKNQISNISLSGDLPPLQGKRVTLNIPNGKFNLQNKNLSNISWTFKYNFRQR